MKTWTVSRIENVFTKLSRIFECGALQKCVNLGDLAKSCQKLFRMLEEGLEKLQVSTASHLRGPHKGENLHRQQNRSRHNRYYLYNIDYVIRMAEMSYTLKPKCLR